MSAKPFFSGRIPQSLYDALEEYRQQTDESKTDVLIKALSNYVNHPVEPPVSSQPGTVETSRITALEKKFETLEQELRVLRGLFTAESSNSISEKPPNTSGKVEEKITHQISLILTEEVIKADNDHDNRSDGTSDNNTDNTTDNKNLDSESSDINDDNQADNRKEDLIHKTFVRTMKTAEVPQLPGLENEDAKKIKVKLNNTKNQKKKTAQIGFYTIALSKKTEASDEKNQGLLWDIYRNEGESAALVIDADNTNDN